MQGAPIPQNSYLSSKPSYILAPPSTASGRTVKSFLEFAQLGYDDDAVQTSGQVGLNSPFSGVTVARSPTEVQIATPTLTLIRHQTKILLKPPLPLPTMAIARLIANCKPRLHTLHPSNLTSSNH